MFSPLPPAGGTWWSVGRTAAGATGAVYIYSYLSSIKKGSHYSCLPTMHSAMHEQDKIYEKCSMYCICHQSCNLKPFFSKAFYPFISSFPAAQWISPFKQILSLILSVELLIKACQTRMGIDLPGGTGWRTFALASWFCVTCLPWKT